MKKLDISIFDGKAKCVSLGCLDKKVVDFIIGKYPTFKNSLSANTDILFWKDRIKHTKLHKNDFASDTLFYSCLENIPDIIQNPDYISIHPKDNSISFIKDFSQHVSVAIRVSTDGKLSYRTMYPIMDAQLMHYMAKGRAWKYENIDK